jgi:hypothetical protein
MILEKREKRKEKEKLTGRAIPIGTTSDHPNHHINPCDRYRPRVIGTDHPAVRSVGRYLPPLKLAYNPITKFIVFPNFITPSIPFYL